VVTSQKKRSKPNGAEAPFGVPEALNLAENEIPTAVTQTVAAFIEFCRRTLNKRIFRLGSGSFVEVF